MAWNRPVSTKKETVDVKGQGARHLVCWLSLLVGAAVAAVLYFALMSDTAPKSDASSAKAISRIKEVRPQIPTRPVATNGLPERFNKQGQRLAKVRPTLGNTGYSNIDYGPIETNRPIRERMWIVDRCFQNPVDNKIASLLMAEPGSGIVGEYSDYYKNFDKKFLKALETPIVITESDTPEEAELKQAVIDTRKDLKERMDAGENLEQVMKDTWQQLKELGAYKEEIKAMVRKTMKENGGKFTVQDKKDLIDAANKMLDDRGCSQITMPEFITRRLEIENKVKPSKDANL